jgi:hypothetical protein
LESIASPCSALHRSVRPPKFCGELTEAVPRRKTNADCFCFFIGHKSDVAIVLKAVKMSTANAPAHFHDLLGWNALSADAVLQFQSPSRKY